LSIYTPYYLSIDLADADLKEKHHGRLPTSMLLLMTELEHEGKSFSRKPLITLSGKIVITTDTDGALFN